MKTIISVLSLSLIVSAAFAQQPVVISVGAGINNPSSSLKEKNYLGNGYNLHGNIFIPFLSKTDSKFALGILAGGMYATSKNLTPDAGDLQAQYTLYNGTLDVAHIQKGGSTSKAFSGSVGVQANFLLNRFTISPSLSGGYYSLKLGGFAEQAAVNVNGTSQTITLLDRGEQTKNGFTFIPQLKTSYAITKAFAVYISASSNIGSKIFSEQSVLEPKGGYNEKNTYEPSQLSAGTMVSKPVSTAYKTLMLHIGGSWSLGRKVKKTSAMPSRLSMTPTTARQTQGKTFGEKVSQGMQPAAAKTTNPLYNDNGTQTTNPLSEQSKLASPGSPIGGIIVKGGKNPGGSLMVTQSGDDGVFEFKALEKGSYSFNLEKRTYTGGRENETADQARPGNPIGGIIVKGGKNPGGGMTNLTVSPDGLIQFDVLEAGDYMFIIQTKQDAEINSNNSRKKKVEKATSGLKDTLKTNV